MFDLLEKLRQKPDRTKKQIAFLVALCFAGIIFVVWLSVIYPNFRKSQLKEEEVSKLEPSPFSNFLNSFKTGASTIKDGFGELKEVVVSIGSVIDMSDFTSSTSTEETISTTTNIEN